MCTRAPLSGCSMACAAAIPAPTSWAISPGVSMVTSRSWVGSLAPGGGLPVGKFRSYRSLSPSIGGCEGEGGVTLCGGLGGGPPLPAPPVPWGLSGGLVAGTAGVLCRHCWVPPSKGLLSMSQVSSAPGLGVGRVRLAGVAGRGTAVATRNNSSCAWASRCSRPAIQSWSLFRCCSYVSTFFWWSAAHFSTLPWNSIRWTFQSRFASDRKATASCIQASCVASCTQCKSLVLECSMIASQTCLVNAWYALADTISSFLTQSPEICSLASICS